MAEESAEQLPLIRYVRVSRMGSDDRNRISVPEQVRKTDQLAAEHGVPVHPDVFEDLNRSGGNLDRKEFTRAINLVREKKAGGIIVATFDRFSRDVEDMLAMLRVIEDAGGRLICGDGPTSLRDGDSEFITTIRAAVSAQERRRRGDYLEGAIRNALDRGVHLQVPFGYQRSAGRGTPLAINEAEAPAVRMSYRLRADGHSWQAIAAAVNATGIMPRPYKRHKTVKQAQWTHKTIRQLVVGRDGEGNRVYLGVAWNGQHEHAGAHPAIIEPEVFHAANEARGTKPVGPDDGHLLSGLVRCAGCGYVMTYNGPDFLRCRAAQHGDGRCPAPAGVNAQQLHDVVLGEFVHRYVECAALGHEADATVLEATAQARRLAMRHANLMALMPDELSGAAGENWRAQEKAAREALAAAERHEADAKAQARGARLPEGLDSDTLAAMIARGEVAEARTLLAAVFAAIVVRRPNRWREPVAERAHIIRRDEAPAHSTGLIAHVRAAAA